ncbi:MAG: YicC family protein [Chloroflexia bacterium]|nr:YicC family protein [Chloroflexia bacterium]
MLKSMTGFGKASADYENKKITIEVKSLNSKQSDINIRMPLQYKEKELALRNELIQKLDRGKIDLSVWLEGGESDKTIQFNENLIKEYYTQLEKVSKIINQPIENEQVMQIIMRMPDVLKTEQKELDEKEWEVILNTTKEAIEQLDIFRVQEGEMLEKDFTKRIERIIGFLNLIKPYEKERIDKVRERINQNLKEFIENQDVDKNRFEQEIIFYLEKFDITEEKVRLRNHTAYFLETMKKEDMPGKKLGFITQEIGREINTIGSKANHAEIQKLVVQMKDELEKIKEQLLNIL